jgi:hypothetical protein
MKAVAMSLSAVDIIYLKYRVVFSMIIEEGFNQT